MSNPRLQWETPPGPPEARDTRPWYRRPMLLVVLAAFAVVAIGALIAMGGDGGDQENNGTVVPPPETPAGVVGGQTGEPGTEPAVIELGEPATVDGLTVTILRVESSNDVTLEDPPEAGQVLVAYEIGFRAETEEQNVGAGRFVLEAPRGEVAEIEYVEHEGWTPQLQNDVVPQGNEITRWIVFNIAEPDGLLGLSYRPEGVGADPGFVFEHECCD
jgi:hypothetical protein